MAMRLRRRRSYNDCTVSVAALCKENKTVSMAEFHQELNNEEADYLQKFGKSSLLGNKDIYQRVTEQDRPQKFTKGFYLIQAPRRANRWTYDGDIVVRQSQYKNFCKLHPLLDNPVAHSNVWKEDSSPMRSSQEMMAALQVFFTNKAWEATVTTIIFNGHGSRSGMLFERGGAMDLNEFLSSTVTMLRECQKSHGWPLRLDVVFAQCYSHLFDNLGSESDVTVISFTNDTKRRTVQRVRLLPYIDGHHVELERMAKNKRTS